MSSSTTLVSPFQWSGGIPCCIRCLLIAGRDEVTEKGSPRRCGGQGDITAGTIATFLAWAVRKAQNEPMFCSGGESKDDKDETPK